MSSDNECVICCDGLVDNSWDFQHTETLYRTLFGDPLESINDTDSFQLLFQSATYCSKCVGKVQDLGILFRELEALQKKLDNEKSQIKNQFRQGIVIDSHNSHNQKLRKKIITRLDEQEGTTDPLNTEVHELLQSCVPVFPEVKILSIGDIFSPPSPTPSISSFNSFEEEKFLPEESSSIDLEQTTPFESTDTIQGLTLTLADPKMKTRISTGVLKKRFTCEESFQLASELKEHKYALGHDGNPAETGTEWTTEPTISVKIRQNNKMMENNSQLLDRISQCNKRLPNIILHKFSDADTNAALKRAQNNTSKRCAEAKPTRSKIRKLPEQRIKNSTGHQHQSISDAVQSEIPDSNPSSQRMAGKTQTHTKLDVNVTRTRCPFFPSCVTTFVKDATEIRIKAHVRKHHEGMKYGYLCEAENCGKSFVNLKELQSHEYRKHKGINPHVCSHCEEVCTSDDHLKLHIAVNHKPEEIRFKCEFCDKAFVNRKRLTLHLMKHTKKLPFMCEICSKTFHSNTLLKYHQSRHHTEVDGPYKCNECGRTFAAPQNLRNHIKRLHRQEFKYQCEICGYGSLTPSELKQHITKRHSNERNFKCVQCGACFKVIHKLNVHMRKHTGERPYVCKIESCGKTFADSGTFRQHQLIHSKEQCHECTICGKTFPVRKYLTIHMKTHNKKKTGETKMNCSEENNA